MMVQVQSTWFPVIDRNPQKFVPNIFLAKADRLPAGHAAGVPHAAVCVKRRTAGADRPLNQFTRLRPETRDTGAVLLPAHRGR